MLILSFVILHEDASPQFRNRSNFRMRKPAQTAAVSQVQFDRAVNHYNSGRYYSALDLFRKLSSYPPEVNPRLSASMMMTMRSYYRIGKYDDAFEVGRKFLEEFQVSTYRDDVYNLFGDVSASQNWFQSAAKHWLTARSITEDPFLKERIDEKLVQLSKGFLSQNEVKDLLSSESHPASRSILNLIIAGGLLRSGDPDGAALVLFRLDRESLPLFITLLMMSFGNRHMVNLLRQ